jgi:hypothetical protein
MLHTRSSVKATRGRKQADIDHLADREVVTAPCLGEIPRFGCRSRRSKVIQQSQVFKLRAKASTASRCGRTAIG